MFKEKDARGMIAAHQQQFEGYALQHRKKSEDTTQTIDYRNQAAVKMNVNVAFAMGAADQLECKSYSELAMRTAAGPEVFHYEDANETDAHFINDIMVYLNAVKRLDSWKSVLFYGKAKVIIDNSIAPEIMHDWSLRGISNPQILHAILGIATEGGELVEDVVRLGNPGAWVDGGIVPNIRREMGDVDWYQELLAHCIGYTVEDCREENIARLAKRYPEKFSEADALARADEVNGFNQDYEPVDPRKATMDDTHRPKQSSSELSSLAARVLNMGPGDIPDHTQLLQIAKRLAGSVMSQDETPGQTFHHPV